MKITLIGMGSGTPASLTAAGRDALLGAELILGARRLLEQLPAECTPDRAALYKAQEICARLQCADIAAAAVVFSGDTGFYSGASALCRALDAAGLPYTVEPGISSVQLLAAALHRPWQDWQLVSAHGCSCDPAAVCRTGKPVFFLTGGSETPATLCRALADAFLRGKTPMTKQEVRAAVLAKLAVRPGDTLWDVGAGTGSVSVEMALAATAGRGCAVECDPEACALIRQNRAKFAVPNLYLTEGRAPAALAGLPAPDAVFIGGSKGSMRQIVDAVLAANPAARLCISAIALETLQEAIAALTAHGLTAQVTQISVSRSKQAGALHLLMANNPVFLIVRE